ncbi:MAG: phosphatase PAP2 family protein [Chloroflexota bacterium]|jgi:membrane-associated phospholipid phosphatase
MKRAILPALVLFLPSAVLLSRATQHLKARYSGNNSPAFAKSPKIWRWNELPGSASDPLAGSRTALIMRGVSELGRPFSGAVMIASAAALLLLWRRRLEALFVLATFTGPAISFLLKAVTHRTRPSPGFEDGILSSINRYSFPSGHVVFFEVFFGFLAYLAYNNLKGAVRWFSVAFSSLLIILVGPSRVFLGAHWASDVAAGYVIGAVWLFLLIFAFRKMSNQLSLHQ